MQVFLSKPAEKIYRKLPINIKKKADKQLIMLLSNPQHPSLRVKKLQGGKDYFEARIDYHYRLVFSKENSDIYIHSLGSHDAGLGKK